MKSVSRIDAFAQSSWQGMVAPMDEHSRIVALEFQVAELRRQLTFLLNHLGLRVPDEVVPPHVKAALEALQHGSKIDAIKRYQQMTGCGLKEAKDAVEVLEAGLRR